MKVGSKLKKKEDSRGYISTNTYTLSKVSIEPNLIEEDEVFRVPRV
jgi:hypothetical protein